MESGEVSSLRAEVIELRVMLREHVTTCVEAKRNAESWRRGVEEMLTKINASSEKSIERVQSLVAKLQSSYTDAFNAMSLQALQIKTAADSDTDLKSLISKHIVDDVAWQRQQAGRMWQILFSALGGSMLLVGYLFAHLMRWT